MIFINPDKTLFELRTARGFYACSVDADRRLLFNAWGACDAGDSPVLREPRPMPWKAVAAMDQHKVVDEVAGYGDEWLREPALAVEIPEAEVGKGEAANLPVRDLRLRFRSSRLGDPAVPYAGRATHGRPVKQAGGEWLILTLADDAYPLEVDLCLRPRPEFDLIERYLVIRNAGPQTVTLRHAWAASLQLPLGLWDVTYLSGAWGAEFTRQHHPLPTGSLLLEGRGLNTGPFHQPTAFFQRQGRATRTAGETYGCQLAWSGHWRMHVEVKHDNLTRIHLGEHPVDSRVLLEPGAELATPMVLQSVSTEGEEGLRRNFQAYHRACTLPKHEGSRPVLYNSWEATYFNLSTEGQIELAEKAAEMGVELFVVDDGWFGGRRNEDAGLGDWYVSPDVFPDGLGPLIEKVHQLGMRFGLWFEPEMVNPDSELYREHPDWVLHFPGRERVESRYQLILDFGNPEVVAHIRSQMEAVLDANEIDFIKWDMNRSPHGAGSKAGERIWRRHVEAVHGLMDGLLQRYPRLTIQSCSSGGGRADAAMLARCCQVWTSDNTDALDRISIQDGYALAYPQETMECWVTHAHNHQTSRELPLRLRFAAAMRGVLGIGSSLDQLGADELKDYRKWIDFYKSVRHLVQGGRLHRAALPETDDGLSVWQFTSENGREAYVSVIMSTYRMDSQGVMFRLDDLLSDTVYRATDETGAEQFTMSGAELMSLGLPALDPLESRPSGMPGMCRHIYLKAV